MNKKRLKRRKKLNFYPINLKLEDKKVLIVGAGKVALRKFKRLSTTTAQIKVVSPDFNPGFDPYLAQNRDRYIFLKRKFKKEDLIKQDLIFIATNKTELNKEIAFLAKKQKALINVADNSAKSDFNVPALFKRGDLNLTISSGGNLPALAKNIRKKLENQFGIEYSILLEIMAEKRSMIISEIENSKLRKKIFRELASTSFLTEIRQIIDKEQANLLELKKEDYQQIITNINNLISEKIKEIKIEFDNNY